MMGPWRSPTRLPGHGGGPSPPSTRPRSSTSTARCRRARPSAGRCCAGRACTRPTSPSGARPELPVSTDWPPRRRPAARPSRSRWTIRRARGGAAKTKLALEIHHLELLSNSIEVEAVIDQHFADLEAATSTSQACVLRSYRRRTPPATRPPMLRPAPVNKLSEPERQHILWRCCARRSTATWRPPVWARLLDDGVYLCSISTMYRLLAIAGESRERRRQRTHPAKKKPELIARQPNEVWSWDRRPDPRRLLRAVRDH